MNETATVDWNGMERALAGVAELARKAVEQTDDTVAAAALLERWAREDSMLMLELTSPYVHTAAKRAVDRAVIEDRARVWKGKARPEPSRKQVVYRNDSVRLMNAISFLQDFRLPGGKKLVQANKAEILLAAEQYSKQGSDMLHKARWLKAIADEMNGECLSEERLKELQEKTRIE